MMNCELLAVCSALGYLEGESYFKEEDCLDSVKCLIKYLQNEDETRTIRTQLGAAHILQNDLLPILIQYSDEFDLFSGVLRLIINLTQPALLCFSGKVPKDTVMHYHFLNVVSYNQDYKESFGKNERVWKVIKEKIFEILKVKWEDRRPEDTLLVERVLVLIRNLLHTPASTEDLRRTNQELSSQDSLIWQLHTSGFDDLLLYMVGCNDEQQWTLHLIEIICLILKEQNAAQLTEVGESSSKAAFEREGQQLKAMRKTEEAQRKLARSKLSRHSRFGGTFVARGTKALNEENDVILHRTLQHCQTISFDDGKQPVVKPRNMRAMIDQAIERYSSRGVRTILNAFCKGFLERGYNMCMRTTKDRLQREHAQDHDETFYFWMMSFFLKFNRLTDFKVAFVSETLNLSTLHFIDTNILNYYELMLNDKHEAQAWSRRLHLALRCYHEFLMSVQLMSNSTDPEMKKNAKVLLNNIFYVVEHREIFLILLRKFDERKQCRGFLRDAVLTTHLFLKMFENFCKDGKVMVEGKKKRKKRKRKKPKNAAAVRKVLSQEEKETKWQDVSSKVNEYLQTVDKATAEEKPVFDPASTLTDSEQQQVCLLRIQNFILDSKVDDAVLYYLSARKIWPETGIFGSTTSNCEEEATDLRQVTFADLSSVRKLEAEMPGHEETAAEVAPAEEESDHDEEEEESSRLHQTGREVEFDYQDYVKKFADANIIRSYATLLRSYETNGQHLNHCIVKMLHRVAYQLKMYGYLFQATIFRIFQQIHKTSQYDQSYREIVALGDWVLRKFFEVFQRNPIAVAELLFWKRNSRECLEITDGYNTVFKKPNKLMPWTDEENEELEQLFNKHREKLQIGDCINSILSEITNANRSEQQVKSQLLKLGSVKDASEFKCTGIRKTMGVWRSEEVEELKTLFDRFVGTGADVVGEIVLYLSRKRARAKVYDKLLATDICTDRTAIRRAGPKQVVNRERNVEPTETPGTSGGGEHMIFTNDEPMFDDNDDDEDEDDDDTLVYSGVNFI